MVKTRFAPSPTGYLHIGGVRTALFNYIYARKHKGQFLVRIEDTDAERSKEEFVTAILDGLDWLNLSPDLEPIKQSTRYDIYKKNALELLNNGSAYRCNCSHERLANLRAEQEKNGLKPSYDGFCRDKGIEDINSVIRIKSPREGETIVNDEVYGTIHFPNKELDDLIILRSDGSPTYHFCNVIDDNEQGVTHVIRGEDHLPNTPRQIQIVNALGYKGFSYAHLPLVLGEDRKRLSKRHAATDLMAYKQQGYLPDALKNMLIRLGWSKVEQEVFAISEILDSFNLADVQRAGAVFDIGRLNFINQEHLALKNDDELLHLIKPFADKIDLDLNSHHDPKRLLRLCVGSGNNLEEIAHFLIPFVRNYAEYSDGCYEKFLIGSEKVLDFFNTQISILDEWSETAINEVIDRAKTELDLPMPKIGMPMRAALLGRTKSPPLDATIYLLKKEQVLERIAQTLKKITSEC